MLTAEDNELLTQCGSGTLGGDFLRRYWYPVAILPDLSDDAPTAHVRVLGEDLVLFKDKSGHVGLLADHCSHRGASLLYGRVEERGIACAYHGWLYDTAGSCLETPAEPADSRFHLTVKQRAYPVRERYGMYWAYLGPAPAPVLPRYDFAELAPLSLGVSRQDCNWLQVVENNLDQSHTVVLHQNTRLRGVRGSNTTRGLIDQLEGLEYTEARFGIRRHRTDRNGYDDTDLMVFPSSARIYNHLSIKVPVDDTHTNTYTVMADLAPDTSPRPDPVGSSRTVEYREERITKSPPDAIHPFAAYSLDGVKPQDLMVLETQGPIAPRQNEHLATADRGVVLMRNLLEREIEKVQRGQDPIGVIRDPDRDVIDTHIHVYLDMMRRFPNERFRSAARQA
jgi:5,5'-dehydrodivanillate O-demethylase oxygenase subunit